MAYTFGFGGGTTNRTAFVNGAGHSVRSTYGGFPGGPVKIYGVSVLGLTGGTATISSHGNGNFDVRCTSTGGTMGFGRNSDNGTDLVDEASGYIWSPRGGLAGSFTWATVAAAPDMVQATPQPGGSILAQFSGSGNDGGAGMTGWELQYATNPNFTAATTISSNGTSTIAGVPGVTYWFRARGSNDVGWSAWSGALSATAKSGGKVRVGGAWRNGITKVRVGGVWRDAIVKVRAGGVWKDAL